MTGARISYLTVDAADPVALARFWSAVPHRPVARGANPYLATVERTPDAPALSFVQVPEGKTAANRARLDLDGDAPAAEVRRSDGPGRNVRPREGRARPVRADVPGPRGQ